MDAGDNPQGASRSRPLSSWKRFRQAQSTACGLALATYARESGLSDCHVLRQDFSPMEHGQQSSHGRRAFHTIVFPHIHGVAIISQAYNLFTLCATGGFKFWRILKFLEIVFIRAVIDVHFGLKVITAFLTGFPIARVSFIEMVTT